MKESFHSNSPMQAVLHKLALRFWPNDLSNPTTRDSIKVLIYKTFEVFSLWYETYLATISPIPWQILLIFPVLHADSCALSDVYL